MTTIDLKRMQRDIEKLKKQVARLERGGNSKRRVMARRRKPATPPRTPKSALSERERAREILRQAGVTRGMAAEEKALAAEWKDLSTPEKRQVEEALRRVHIDPPLSQLIHEMRS